MTESFVDPQQLIIGGERRFAVQVERLLGLLRYTDIVNIDGSGDVGGDLLGTIAGQQWVFQAKWQKKGSVPANAVDEVSAAMDHYRADRGVVVTNVRPSEMRFLGRKCWLVLANASTSGMGSIFNNFGSRPRAILREFGCAATKAMRLPR